MIAGPSEILVLADGSTPADWVAMDLFSQAEHDELAQSILLCPDAQYIAQVQAAIDRLLPEMPRAEIIAKSLNGRGALIHTRTMEEACEISNRIAPEHLEIASADPHRWEPLLRHAGAIFLGAYTSESLGDYCAGPNHVLPTSTHGALLQPAGRLRLPEAQQHHRGERGRRPGAWARSPPNWPTARACRRMPARRSCGSSGSIGVRPACRGLAFPALFPCRPPGGPVFHERHPGPTDRHPHPAGRAVHACLRDPGFARHGQARCDGESAPAAAGAAQGTGRAAGRRGPEPLSRRAHRGPEAGARAARSAAGRLRPDARQRLGRTDLAAGDGLRPARRDHPRAAARASSCTA